MPAWLVWGIAAAALGVAELLTLTLVLGMLALAAVAAALSAGLGANELVQVVVFGATSLGLLAVARPVARRHLRMPLPSRTGVAALVGRPAVVVDPVGPAGGRVKIGGEVWSARSYDGLQAIPVGATVSVLEIEGATALVYSEELP